jgi:hypothetical protein
VPPPQEPTTIVTHHEQIYEERETKVFQGRQSKTESAKSLPRAPRFVKELPSELEIKEGDKIQFHVAVEADPPVTFTWYVNGFELRKTGKVSVDETTINQSVLQITPPAKTGDYKVVTDISVCLFSLFSIIF